MVAYEASICNETGDVMFIANNEDWFDYTDLWLEMDNYDIVNEDEQQTLVVGAMTEEQFKELVEANEPYQNII